MTPSVAALGGTDLSDATAHVSYTEFVVEPVSTPRTTSTKPKSNSVMQFFY